MLLAFQPWHLELARKTVGILGVGNPEVFNRLGAANLLYTIVTATSPTKILGFAGAAPKANREKTAEVFIVATPTRAQYPRVFARSVKDILAHCRTQFCRIEATCKEEDSVSRRWLHWLGFRPSEGFANLRLWVMEAE